MHGDRDRIEPASAQRVDRTQLPNQTRNTNIRAKLLETLRDAKFPPIKLLQPPEGLPDVGLILLDDIGFGAPSTFSRSINMSLAVQAVLHARAAQHLDK